MSIFLVSHVEAQTNHIIKSIYFEGGSYYIDEFQSQALFDLLDSIPDIQQFSITIHSYTDNIGGANFNEWLSQERSRSATQELLRYNISGEMIEIKDFGQFNPVYDNSTSLGRRKNRRVDIILWPLTL